MTDDLRELDKRCAEAMGWEPQAWPKAGMVYAPPAGPAQLLPCFSSRIEHTWTLVEFMRERGWFWSMNRAPGGKLAFHIWRAKPEPLGYYEVRDEAPEAVSRAFLAAMEAK